jgi:hypothetical protein
MYSWNEWLAWLCLLSNAHMQQRTAVLLYRNAADCTLITVQLHKQDVQLDEWFGMALLC